MAPNYISTQYSPYNSIEIVDLQTLIRHFKTHISPFETNTGSEQKVGVLLTGPQLGGKRGRLPPKQKFAPLKYPACPPEHAFPLRQFQDGGFFMKNNRKLGNK